MDTYASYDEAVNITTPDPSAFAKSVAHPMSTPERNQEDPRATTISDTMMYKRWRAHRGNPIRHIDDERGIPDEDDEDAMMIHLITLAIE